MILKWLPWKFIASRLARRHGFLDPIGLLAKLQSFAQPSEVDAPVELLRAGMVLHARGLINTKVIQQNLDWVWPYWVQRQFDPTDPSFLPRAFSITHINLTHRNWTAVGLPGCEAMPIVDPRGMLTPFFDGWSLDAWILPDDGPPLFPSHAPDDAVEQTFLTGGEPAISTRIRQAGMELRSHAQVVEDGSQIVCRLDCAAATDTPGWLAIAVRPFNPEGVSFISRLHHDDGTHLRINRASCVTFSRGIERCLTSNYQRGDVAVSASRTHDSESQECDVGLCTAAALFRIGSDMSTNVSVDVSLADDNNSTPLLPTGRTTTWPAATRDTCMLDVPDERFVRLYDQAKHTLVLLSPKDPYPGPFTYKRFWFRDATYLLHAMLCLGLTDRAQAALAHFEQRQTMTGFFHSQQGEWDSNGQVLWLLRRFVELTGRRLSSHWTKPIRKAVHWIHRKRLPVGKGELRDGLMPAGFSAEHLGNNDYYYWDDYWSVAGLRAADVLMADAGEEVDAAGCR
ncbi:MAG: hypothetical protein KGY81_04680, partial [Phycisphaerae bacterium]|nr:hypothetical protein [Phycisphaerae bacterium]